MLALAPALTALSGIYGLASDPAEVAGHVRDLLAAAHGAPARLCALASRAVGSFGRSGWRDATTPVPPEPDSRGR